MRNTILALLGIAIAATSLSLTKPPSNIGGELLTSCVANNTDPDGPTCTPQ